MYVCYGNRDKFRPDGPLGSYADLTFTTEYPFELPWVACLTDSPGGLVITVNLMCM